MWLWIHCSINFLNIVRKKKRRKAVRDDVEAAFDTPTSGKKSTTEIATSEDQQSITSIETFSSHKEDIEERSRFFIFNLYALLENMYLRRSDDTVQS